MFKLYFADKDTYITNKIIGGERKVSSSVGYAGTLDLFKLYGMSYSGSTPNTELSRLLIHFDLSNLKKLYESNQIDITHDSFNCTLNLNDVYGGQPTPSNFNLSLYPLSQSFSEGFGKDIVYLLDYDSANFLSSSFNTTWELTGAAAGGSITSSSGIDYITHASYGSTKLQQFFKTGEENLKLNVTPIISATLAGEIPDSGFRISFDDVEEEDQYTYFVKRFASRHAYDNALQPTLTVGFDDSINDETLKLNFGSSSSIFLYNYENDQLKNLTHNQTILSGNNCIKLTLNNSNYLGQVNLSFTGSQFSNGNCWVSGTYYSQVSIPLTPEIKQHLNVSGSVEFEPVWTSLDNNTAFLSGSKIQFLSPTIFSKPLLKRNLVVNVTGTPHTIKNDEISTVRVNVFDFSDPMIRTTKFTKETKSLVFSRAYYQIRDLNTDKIVVPFDELKNSTKLSSDSDGMYFKLDGSSLFSNKTYTVDIMLVTGNDKQIFKNVSTPFISK